jgi:hypothetical protein
MGFASSHLLHQKITTTKTVKLDVLRGIAFRGTRSALRDVVSAPKKNNQKREKNHSLSVANRNRSTLPWSMKN